MKAKRQKQKITVSVDSDFYPILQALPSITGQGRDELVIEAIKGYYREEIARIAQLATAHSGDEDGGSVMASADRLDAEERLIA